MDQSISLRYMRTVQQLEKKKEEVGRLLQDAKSLDTENVSLKHLVAQQQETIRGLENRDQQRQAEIALLETSLKKQQQRIQGFIDREASAPSPGYMPSPMTAQPTTPPPPLIAHQTQPVVAKRQGPTDIERRLTEELTAARTEVAALNSKFLDSERGRVGLEKDLQTAEERYRAVERDLDSLRSVEAEVRAECDNLRTSLRESERKEGSYRAALHHLNDRQVSAAREAMEMEDVEAKALEGLRAEINVLEGENQHLRDALQEERTQYRSARVEFEKSAQLLIKQKALHDAHQKISAEEIRALTLQTESMLQDMRNATSRDGLRKQLEELRVQDKVASLISPVRRQSVAKESKGVQSASELVTVRAPTHHTSTAPGKDVDAVVRVLEGQLSSLQRRYDDMERGREELNNRMASLHSDNMTLTRHRDELEVERNSLRESVKNMKLVLQEHEDTTDLRRERDTLQTAEMRKLEADLHSANQRLSAAEQRPASPALMTSSKSHNAEGEHLREIVSQCLVLATTVFHLLQTCVPQWDEEGTDETGTVGVHALHDPALQAAFDEAFGVRFVLQRAKGLVKSLLRQQYQAATPRVVVVPTPRPQSQSRAHSIIPDVSRVQREESSYRPSRSVRSGYTEGTSLKDVVSEFSRQSPRHHVRFDAMRVNMRDGLSMAHWSGRKERLLRDSSE